MKTHVQEISITPKTRAYCLTISTQDGDLMGRKLFNALMSGDNVNIPRELVKDIILGINNKACVLEKYAGKEFTRVKVRTKTIEMVRTKKTETTPTGTIVTKEFETRSIVLDDDSLAIKTLYDILMSNDEVTIPRELVIDLLSDDEIKTRKLTELADENPELQSELAKMDRSTGRRASGKIEWGQGFE